MRCVCPVWSPQKSVLSAATHVVNGILTIRTSDRHRVLKTNLPSLWLPVGSADDIAVSNGATSIVWGPASFPNAPEGDINKERRQIYGEDLPPWQSWCWGDVDRRGRKDRYCYYHFLWDEDELTPWFYASLIWDTHDLTPFNMWIEWNQYEDKEYSSMRSYASLIWNMFFLFLIFVGWCVTSLSWCRCGSQSLHHCGKISSSSALVFPTPSR